MAMNMLTKDMPCFFYCPPDCPIHRSCETKKDKIEKQRQKEGGDKLPVLLGRKDLCEKCKPSEKARAGYEKANLSHRRDDYRKIHFSDSKEAKAEEIATRYPNQVERELICSFVGQWVLRKPTDSTPAWASGGHKMRDAPRNHQLVPADMFEISDSGALFDISLSQYILSDYDKGWHLGDFKVKQYLSDSTGKHLMLSQTDKDGTEHIASVSHFLQDDDGNTFPQTLQWNNGEVWTRKRPELEELNGHWHKFLPNGKCVPMSLPLSAPTHHGPNGELEVCISPDSENVEKLWVIMEQDPEHPGTKRLRWSNGQSWYPGQGSIERKCSFSRTAPHLGKFSSEELQSRECSPVILSPSDSSIIQDVHKISLKEESLHAQSAELSLDHIQNRDGEIQGLSSSVEDGEIVYSDCLDFEIVGSRPQARPMMRWSDSLNGFFVKPLDEETDTLTGNKIWMELAEDRRFWESLEEEYIKKLQCVSL